MRFILPQSASLCSHLAGVSAMKISGTMLAAASVLALGCGSAMAQQTTGTPGSPGATTTIDGKQLPRTAKGRAQRFAHNDG
jgi:hypothetical protein